MRSQGLRHGRRSRDPRRRRVLGFYLRDDRGDEDADENHAADRITTLTRRRRRFRQASLRGS